MKKIFAAVSFFCLTFSCLSADSDSFSLERLEDFYDGYGCDEKNVLNQGGLASPCLSPSGSPAPPAPPHGNNLPPISKKDLIPIVIKNTLGVSADRIFVVVYGPANSGDPVDFIDFDSKGDPTRSPITATSSSFQHRFLLSSLPFSTTNGPDAYLMYLPFINSGRVYFSVDSPLYLLTNTAAQTVTSPLVFDPTDPNYEFLSDNIELTFAPPPPPPAPPPAPGDIDWTATINTTAVDAFGIPIETTLYSFPSQMPLSAVSLQGNSGPAGFNKSKSILITAFQTFLATVATDPTAAGFWDRILVRFFSNPYDATEMPNTFLRILSPNSSFSATPIAGFGNNNAAFPITYLSTATTEDFVTAFFDKFAAGASTLTIDTDLVNAGTDVVYTSSAASTATSLVMDAPAAPAGATTFAFAKAPLVTDGSPFFTGTLFPMVPPSDATFGARLQDYMDVAFTLGLLPDIAAGVTLNSAFFSSSTNFDTLFFKNNPSGIPWFNVYSGALHKEAVNRKCYTFPFDDAMGLGGDITPNNITPKSTNPYVLVTLHDASPFPDPFNDPNSYDVTFTFAGISLNYRQGSSGPWLPVSSGVPIGPSLFSNKTTPLQIQYTTASGTFIFTVYLKYQFLQPKDVYQTDENAITSGTTFTPVGAPDPTGFGVSLPG